MELLVSYNKNETEIENGWNRALAITESAAVVQNKK